MLAIDPRVAVPWVWLFVLACGGSAKPPTPLAPPPPTVPPVRENLRAKSPPPAPLPPAAPACGGPAMRVAFYNAGHALRARDAAQQQAS